MKIFFKLKDCSLSDTEFCVTINKIEFSGNLYSIPFYDIEEKYWKSPDLLIRVIVHYYQYLDRIFARIQKMKISEDFLFPIIFLDQYTQFLNLQKRSDEIFDIQILNGTDDYFQFKSPGFFESHQYYDSGKLISDLKSQIGGSELYSAFEEFFAEKEKCLDIAKEMCIGQKWN